MYYTRNNPTPAAVIYRVAFSAFPGGVGRTPKKGENSVAHPVRI